MFSSKSGPVKSTIQATLRQLFSIIFTLFVHQCKSFLSDDSLFDGASRKKGYINYGERQTIA